MRPRLLLLEDDDQMARAIARALSTRGDVHRARTVTEAMRLVEAGGYAAFVSDWEIGAEIALDVLALSKRLHPHARRVVLSGSDPAAIRARLPDATVDAILQKPCATAELIASLDA